MMKRPTDGRRLRVMPVFGTRPEAIKLAPVISALAEAGGCDTTVVVTAQHRGLLDDMLELFEIRPDVDLDIMRPGQTPADVAAAVLSQLSPVLAERRPDWIIVQGDTTTVMAAAIAAHYAGTRVAHVEAGLRSFDRRNPFPEEVNRVVTSHVADLHFAPTASARDNLLREGVSSETIIVTGNTVIDALMHTAGRPWEPTPGSQLAQLPRDKRLLLVTAHRRESFGTPLAEICEAIAQIADRADVHIVFPVHPNPNVTRPVNDILGMHPTISLLEPLDYAAMTWLLARCHLVLTDSGGLQEEAPSLDKPVLVLRDVTERPEGVAAGTARLVGTNRASIVRETTALLNDPGQYAAMARAVNPFGDGRAAERIVAALNARGRDAPSVFAQTVPVTM